MRRILPVFAAIFIMSLMLAGCTTSQSQRYPRYPNYPPSYPGYPSPYPGGPGGYGSGQQLPQLADSLQKATNQLEEKAGKSEPAIELEDLNKIEALNNEAEDFSSEMRDPYMDQRRTGNDFQDLLKKYYVARGVVREIPEPNEIHRDFDQVTQIMRNITAFYGYRLDPDENSEPIIR